MVCGRIWHSQRSFTFTLQQTTAFIVEWQLSKFNFIHTQVSGNSFDTRSLMYSNFTVSVKCNLCKQFWPRKEGKRVGLKFSFEIKINTTSGWSLPWIRTKIRCSDDIEEHLTFKCLTLTWLQARVINFLEKKVFRNRPRISFLGNWGT